MNRLLVDSSDLHSVGYDSSTLTLEIEFNSGGIYQYYGVSKEVYERLLAAPSLGKFFPANIRNVYRCKKIA
jgi:hypothetical protein